MKLRLLGGVAASALAFASAAHAEDFSNYPVRPGADCDPYVNYKCLDAYLGDNPVLRLARYYELEWGHDSAPSDPTAPPGRRDYWPATPESTPPMPFTEWPYGGSTTIGVTRPSSVDSPLMMAIGNTALGQAMNDAHIQVYGWVNVGGNLSTSEQKPGGNAPAAYAYTPNTVTLDQAVVYVERLPDTVQKDHVDWGFRFSALYGENYRYTNAYGLLSYQYNGHNLVNGWDFPMVYGEVFFPGWAEGLLVRVGRFISLPDIEAQLAPNNYMYSHSLTYAYDNYTNTGIQTTLAVTKNWFFQLGLSVGTEAMPWHMGKQIPNFFPNPVFPNATYPMDPGAMPSITVCNRYQTDSGNDNVYLCADAINSGIQGYNNLQWFGGTYYHKFDEHWHISLESYYIYNRNVLNLNNPTAANILASGGSPFSPQNIAYNQPNSALCGDSNVLTCNTRSYSALSYLNYSPDKLNNFSFRTEYYVDEEGQRTGIATRYMDIGLGWQHWFSPQVEIRPELTYYKSFNAPAFDNNLSNPNNTPGPTKYWELVGSADLIWHF